MDPASHVIVGIALSKAMQPYIGASNMITAAFALGSLLPDADIVLQKWGDYFYLRNHRGASHSIVGIVIGSLLTSAVLAGINGNADLFAYFVCCFFGAMAHVGLDIFNSYGAEILWPLSCRKFTLNLLPIFDPVIAAALLGYIFVSSRAGTILIFIAIAYIVLRLLMKLSVRIRLNNMYFGEYKKIYVLPSTTRLFNWHFVVCMDKCNIVGEASTMCKKIKIFRELPELEHSIAEKIEDTLISKFFKKFTPLCHVTCRKTTDGILEFLLIDMRYFIKNNFLHHATAILGPDYKIVGEFFQPYNIKRKIEI